jgi:predicted nucleotidyltransferase component of viral defense system
MITKQELLKVHKEKGIPLSTIEKDYILGLVLACLYRHPVLKDHWVFKGGTCLKKVYIEEYRFSEDLDFTLSKEASINPEEIKKHLLEAFAIGADLFGLIIDKGNITISPFPDKAGLFIQIKIPFQSPLMSAGSLPRVKLDLSKDELIVDVTSLLPLLHSYSDSTQVQTLIQSYSLDEIFAEKCRAFVERTRPRDLYDVVNLYENFYHSKTTMESFLKVAEAKFRHKGLSFPKDFLQIPQSQFQDTRESWSHMLAHQISLLGQIDPYIQKYKEMREWLDSHWM